MTDAAVLETTTTSRAKRLKAETHAMHERLDRSIMAGRPFESRERYGRFVVVQHAFHRDLDVAYDDPRLAFLPDLAGRRRLDLIRRDAEDLGIEGELRDDPPALAGGEPVGTLLGWLYVAEGSNLGAAFLIKEAARLDLSENFGARHLAGHPDGRGLHWRTFVAALDAYRPDGSGEDAILAGARTAFARVQALVDAVYG